MVTTITMQDGEKFTGTPKSIVREMQQTEWGHPPKKRTYIVEATERVWDQTGIEPPPGKLTAEQFLDYLVAAGVATRNA